MRIGTEGGAVIRIDPFVLIFWGLVTFVTPLVMMVIPYYKGRISEDTLHLMLGFSAGLLGGITVMDILPEAFASASDSRIASGGIAVGLFILFIVERHMLGAGRRRSHVHVEDDTEIRPLGTLAMSALTIHGIVDGFIIPIGYSFGGELGLVITLAVALHQIPDSFSAASISLAAGYNRRKTAFFILLTALDTPLGIIIGYCFLGIGDWIVPFGLGLTAGTFIFVTAADLIPELQHKTSSVWVTVSIVLGFVFVMSMSLWIAV